MGKLLLIVFFVLRYSSVIFSQQNTLIACPPKRFDTARCKTGEHIILESIDLIGKDTRCSSILHTGSNPSAQTGCCKFTTGDMKLATFTLPSDDPTVNTLFKLAINSCSFDRDSCVIPTRPEVFQMDYGGRQVDVVAYNYRCLKDKSTNSLCGGTAVKAPEVVVTHDGSAAGAAVDCQCSISSNCDRRISVRITYRKTTDCSLQLKEGNSIRLVKCKDSVAVNNMESVGNTLMLKMNSSETNTIALEFSGTQGSQVSVKCGHNLPTSPHEDCSTPTSTSSSTSAQSLSTTTLPSTSTSEPSLSTTTSPTTSTPTTLKTTTYINYHIMSSLTTQSADTRASPSSNLQKHDSLKYVVAGCVSGVVVIAFGTLLLVAYFRIKVRVSPMMNRKAHLRINRTY